MMFKRFFVSKQESKRSQYDNLKTISKKRKYNLNEKTLIAKLCIGY